MTDQSGTERSGTERSGTERSGRHRVVIVGGGFAGLFAARTLKRSNVSVTLIDRAQHHVFQPLLYQCATGILSEGKIASPLRDLLKKYKSVDCVMAEGCGSFQDRIIRAGRCNAAGLMVSGDHAVGGSGLR
jgi:NADH dehydrogenase